MSISANENIPVHLLDKPGSLLQNLPAMEQSSTLSFDLEFDNNSYSYGVTLCLVQVATPQACYLIDPLAGLDLAPLFALFDSPAIQKIVHAPGEDLRLLHSLGCYPQNVYDTEVVARLLNYEQTSLSVMLREKLAVVMDKKQQRSNWLRRPLTPAQLHYAANDVTWLHGLKTVLEGEAGEKNLLSYVMEEQAMLSTTIYPAVAKTDFLKPADLYTLSPQQQYITNELFLFREKIAQSLDKPAYQIMPEELVRNLAAGNLHPQSILDASDVHPRFRTSRSVAQLQAHLEMAKQNAASQNLSPEKQARQRVSLAQHAAFQKAAEDRKTVFAPIQQWLVEQFGEHAARFLLSNRQVNNLLSGVLTLQQFPPYRRFLFRNIAAAMGTSLRDYDDGS